MAQVSFNNEPKIDVNLQNTNQINATIQQTETTNVDLPPINYIPGYKEAEAERRTNEVVRQSNETERIALYEDMEQKLENGYFDGKDGQDGKDGAIQYTAGSNIQISDENVISATDTTYTAGTGIEINNGVISNTQTSAEWGNITGTLSNQTDLNNVLNTKANSATTYTKTEVNDLISNINSFNVEVVQTLPVSDIDPYTIYLVLKTGSAGDIYNEYIYINNNWELIGNTQIDLTDYVKFTDYATANTAGVLKTGYRLKLNENGQVYAETISYANYQTYSENSFISKGTLENVFEGKGFVSKDDYLGNINVDSVKSKNMLDVSSVENSSGNSMTLTNNNDGSITFTGTASANTSFTFELATPITLKGGVTYTYSLNALNKPGNNNANINLRDNTNTALITLGANQDSTTYTPVNDTTLKYIRFYIVKNGVLNNYTSYPQLEIGGTPTRWSIFKDYDFNNKQDKLVSGTNIKTINNTSLLGSGDITINADDEIAISTTQPTDNETVWIDPNESVNVYGNYISNSYGTSQEIGYSQEYVNNANSYSTSEVMTNKRWIDGKPIYRKIIEFGALPNATAKSVAHSISNLSNVIYVKGWAKRTDGVTFPIPYVSGNNLIEDVAIYTNNTNVTIYCGTDRTEFANTYITLEYTKTN